MDKPTTNIGLRDFLKFSLSRCLDDANAKSGSIFLLDDANKELVLEVSKNSRGLKLEGLKTKVGEGIVGRVAVDKEPLLVKDVADFSKLKGVSPTNRYASNSFLSVPLEYSGKLIGVINITDRVSGDSFDDDDLIATLDACKYLGIAIYKLKKYLDNQRLTIQKLNSEIKALQKSMEHSSNYSSLGKLAGGIVHELNNPLDGIIRYVNLALDCSETDAVVREYLLEAKQGLNRIASIVHSLLDFSWNLSRAANFIDVNRVIDDCVFLAKDLLSSHSIEVQKDLCLELPPVPNYRLQMVFTNMIKNACGAMAEKGGKLSVSTSLVDNKIEIRISDTGCGIPEDIQGKVFEPFFTTKSIGQGAGLGLAICYETIQRYNGKIRLESKLGKGTAFIIQLPISQ